MCLQIDKPIISLTFDDVKIYRDFSMHFYDNIIYSIDNEEKDLLKDSIRLFNPFDLNINNKKFLLSLHKNINGKLNDSQKSTLSKIESELFELFDDFIINENIPLTYTAESNLINLLSIYKFSFCIDESQNFLEKLINFLKINNEYSDTHIIISNNLIENFTKEEIALLETELNLLDIHIIDLSLNKAEIKSKELVIDSNWCIL